MPGLSIAVSAEPGAGGPRSVIRLAGEADVTTPELRQALDAEAARRPRLLLVDASALTFIDSSALHWITRASLRLRADGGLLALIAPGPQVKRVLALTGLDTVVSVCITAAEAEARLPGTTGPAGRPGH